MFQQHALKPHPPAQQATQPHSKLPAVTLRGVLPPVLNGEQDAEDEQDEKQRDEQIFPSTERLVVAAGPGEKIPEIGERIHWRSPAHFPCRARKIPDASPFKRNMCTSAPPSRSAREAFVHRIRCGAKADRPATPAPASPGSARRSRPLP